MADIYKQGSVNGNTRDHLYRNVTRPKFPSFGKGKNSDNNHPRFRPDAFKSDIAPEEQKEKSQKQQEYDDLLNKDNKTDAEFKRLGQLLNELNIIAKYEDQFDK